MQVKERVFVMRLHKYSESDLIIHCLTNNGARLSLFARSALKSKKRFGGGVFEPTHYIEVVYENRRADQNLYTVKEAQIIRDFKGVREDYDRLELGLHMVGLLDKVIREGDSNSSQMFDLLGNSLGALETTSTLEKLRLQFEAKLLNLQGVLAVGAEEAVILRLPVSAHEQIPFVGGEFRAVNSRVQLVLREYLNL